MSLRRSCSCSLGFGLSFGLGLWLTEPETLSDTGMSTFPKFGVSDVGESTDLGLNFLGLYKGLDSLSMRTHGIGVVGLHILQPLLVVLLGKAHVPQELGVYLEGRKGTGGHQVIQSGTPETIRLQQRPTGGLDSVSSNP